MHDQLPPPLFGESSKILNSVRASNLAWLPPTVQSNCSEAVCLAARTLLLQCREVSTPTILPNFICNCRDSVVFAFGGGIERKRKRMSRNYTSGKFWVTSIRLPWPTRTVPLANQGGSPGQPKKPLFVATAVRYNCYVQLVATKRDWMRVPNLKFWSPRQRGGGSWSCTSL